MKAKFVCFKLSKTIIGLILIILLQLIFIVMGIKEVREQESFVQIKENINNKSNLDTYEQDGNKNMINSETENKDSKNNITSEGDEQTGKTQEEYKDMPRELKGYKVIGKITIPKVKLDTYILEETNTKSLKVSVTKLYGPNINEIGNFCIAGHNYINNKMFGGIKKLEINDEIILTDTYGKSVTYKVYESYKIEPKNVECLNQETGGEREVTLITCTAGAIKRVIVKAVEVYD